jgi:hypothetical protein
MTVIGETTNWGDLFPTHFLPDIFDLVIETWERFEKPSRDAQEPPITRRFRSALIQAKRYKILPFLIMREDVEDDFESGEEIGRKDIAFYPTHHEEVYFAFECKRLNALVGGKLRALASEYVSDGMSRFVTAQYARFMSHGGMIGYVLDGRCQHAMALVESNIQSRHGELSMEAPGNFLPSQFRPDSPVIRETEHKLSRLFQLHHIFLACLAAETDEAQ